MSADPTSAAGLSSLLGDAKPLGDPLLGFRRFIVKALLFFLPVGILLSVGGFHLEQEQLRQQIHSPDPASDGWSDDASDRFASTPEQESADVAGNFDWGWIAVVPLIIFVGAYPPLLFIVSLLPRRRVNALYLRSFRNDRQSWPIRKAVQQALGRSFRLSGIRDPRRRFLPIDYLAFSIMLLRYSTPKFMNLEAGGDWKARLWRSLEHTRCVIIDVSEFTEFIEHEIALCFHAMDQRRILFIADVRLAPADWKEKVRTAMPPNVDDGGLRFVEWRGEASDDRQAFSKQVASFATELPRGCDRPKHTPEIIRLTADSSDVADGAMTHGHGFVASYLGIHVAAGIAAAVMTAAAPALVDSLGLFLTYIPLAVVAWFFIAFLVECTRGQRVWACTGLAFLCLYALSLQASYLAVREAANTNLCHNRLKRIGLGMQIFHDFHSRYPAAYSTDKDGRPLLSWRVHLLPMLDQMELYKKFNLREPWDSTHNRKLIAQMPDVYACPSSDIPSKEGRTNYVGVVGRPFFFRQRGDAQSLSGDDLVGGRSGRNRPSVRDDPTIAVLEVPDERAVIWTKPDDWYPTANSTAECVGSNHTCGFVTLSAIGTTDCLSESTPMSELLELCTCNGSLPPAFINEPPRLVASQDSKSNRTASATGRRRSQHTRAEHAESDATETSPRGPDADASYKSNAEASIDALLHRLQDAVKDAAEAEAGEAGLPDSYVDSEYGFSLTIPNGWQKSKEFNFLASVVLSVPSDEFNETFSVIVTEAGVTEPHFASEAFAGGLQEAAQAIGVNAALERCEVGGRVAWKVSYEMEREGRTVLVTEWKALYQGLGYTITWSSMDNYSHPQQVEEILESLKFAPSED